MDGDGEDYPDYHPYKEFAGDIDTKANAAKIVKVLGKLSHERKELFVGTAFHYFSDIKPTKGDGILLHGLFLHEVLPDEGSIARQQFRFRFGDREVTFGGDEFCLITGLKFGYFLEPNEIPLVESSFRSRVFPHTTDAGLKVGDVKALFEEANRLANISDLDAVLATMLYILVVCFLGMDSVKSVGRGWLSLLENAEAWNDYAWGSFLWERMYRLMGGVFNTLQRRAIRERAKVVEGTFKMSLSAFTYPLKIWIWEMFPRCQPKHCKKLGGLLLPRMRSWKRGKMVRWGDVQKIFGTDKEPLRREQLPLSSFPVYPEEEKTDYFRHLENWLSRGAYTPLQASFYVPQGPPPARRKKYRSEDTSSSSGPSTGASSSEVRPRHTSSRPPKPADLQNRVTRDLESRIRRLENDVRGLKRTTNGDLHDSGNNEDSADNEMWVKEVDNTARDREDDHVYKVDLSHIVTPAHRNSILQNDGQLIDDDVCEVIKPADDRKKGLKPDSPRNFAGPRRSLRDHKPSKALKSPYTQVRSTPPRPCVRVIQKTSIPDTGSEMKQLLLEEYRLHGVSTQQLFKTEIYIAVRHRLYPLQIMEQQFWDCIYGRNIPPGWLDNAHVSIWVNLLMESAPGDARWTIMPTIFFSQHSNNNDWASYARGEVELPERGKAWWEVDRVLFPICIPEVHWLLGQLNLESMIVYLYDSLGTSTMYDTLSSTMELEKHDAKVNGILQRSGYWAHKGEEPREVQFKYEVVGGLPVQAPPSDHYKLGDCGVFVCMWMERLVSGWPLTFPEPPMVAALSYRYRMADIIWGSYK